MKRGYFLKLTGFSGIGLFAGTPALAGFFDNIPPENQNYIPVCGIYPDTLSIGEKGVHLRWLLPPSKGFPDVITIYRKKAVKDPVLPLFTPSPANLDKLKEWCDQKNQKGWIVVGEINNARDFADAELIYKRIANSNSYNFYLPASGPARAAKLQQYRLNASAYAGIFKALRNPDDKIFLVQSPYTKIEDIPADKLTFRPKKISSHSVKAWNVLQFASIDPNIARMLGFYFVDTGADAPRDFYDYKIEAHYKSRNETICGVVLQVSKDFSSKPLLQQNLVATQIEKTTWQFNSENAIDKQLGKVRLSWPMPEPQTNELQKRYTEPVIYALTKNQDKQKLILPQQDESRLFFLDREAVVANNQYQAVGIDLFGQISNLLTAACNVQDRDVPPSPVRLRFSETAQTLRLQFEYGASQYLSSPDVKQFRVYKRYNTVNDSAKFKFSLQPGVANSNKGENIYTLTLQNAGNLSDYRSASFAEDAGGKKLPAAARKKLRIISSAASSISILCTSKRFAPLQNGFVILNKEVNTKTADWLQPIAIVDYREPLRFTFVTGNTSYTHFIKNSGDNDHFSGESVNDTKAFTCTAVKVLPFVTQKDRFDESKTFTPENFTEILIDRALLFSDMFTGGKMKTGGQTYDILYQSSGIATPQNISAELSQNASSKNKYARIVVKDHIPVSSGATLKINLKTAVSTQDSGADKLHGYIILRIQSPSSLPGLPGGEFLLNASSYPKIDVEEVARDVKVIAKICSGFSGSNSQEVLVQLDKHIHDINTASALLCFYPYQVDITSAVKDPAMPLAASDALRSAYFAAETLDKTNPAHVSPLSSIVQFLKVRNIAQKPAAPSAPYPCNTASASAGYLKPADKEGNTTFCVQWNGSTNGIRYEVGRALDKTIVATHKDLWLKAIIDTASPFVAAPVSTNGGVALTASAQDANTGLVPANAVFNLGAVPAENFKGGRLTQQISGNKTSFEIVNVYRDANTLKFLLRPMIKGVLPANAGFKIEQLPSYKEVFNDNQKLAQIANLSSATIPDSLGAFSIVTAMPLRNANKFLDKVPGRGNGRFFYKVRAVDASENRSLWSPASVPVYQTDTAVPAEPVVIYTEGLEQSAYLKWMNENDTKVAGYHLYRTDKKVDPQNAADYATEKLIAVLIKQNPSLTEKQITKARIRHLNNKIQLPLHQVIDATWNVTGVFKINAAGAVDTSVNYYSPANSSFDRNKKNVSALLPGLQQAEAVAVQITKPGIAPVMIYEDEKEYEFIDQLHQMLTKELFYNYRLEAVKRAMVNNVPVNIRSRKTKDRLIRVSMNVIPPAPEVKSIEWWDTRNNRAASRNSTQTAVKFNIVVADNRGYCVIKRFSKEKNVFEVKLANLTAFVQQADGKFALTAVDANADVRETSIYQVEFVNNWDKKNSTTIDIKSL